MIAIYKVYKAEPRKVNISLPNEFKAKKILEIVSDETGVPLDRIQTKGRQREIADAKVMARFCLRKYTTLSLTSIAAMTGATNHSTTWHSLSYCVDMVDTDKYFRHQFVSIEKTVSGLFPKIERI